jgi:hypothetical protein
MRFCKVIVGDQNVQLPPVVHQARILYRNSMPVDMWPRAHMSAVVRYDRGSRPLPHRGTAPNQRISNHSYLSYIQTVI